MNLTSLLLSEDEKLLTLEEVNEKVRQISEEYHVSIRALEDQDLLIFPKWQRRNSNFVEAENKCSGQLANKNSVEVVVEGDGCVGIVYRYANGYFSLTEYCSNGDGTSSLVAYECYAPASASAE